MDGSIRVQVHYFSHVRHVLGRERDTLELPPSSTAGDVEARLRDMADGRLRGVVFRLAVNQAYVSSAHPLRDGDEIALIAPVQGG